MAQTNTYTPAGLTYRNAYNWARSGYNNADVPTTDPNVIRQQTAYEWFQWGSPTPGGQGQWTSNPPFNSGAAGRLLPTQVNPGDNAPARILRGFIRRAEYNVADPTSLARLYFMYNPEQIQREYVNYLDQGALDPFNTVFQSGNLVAPPSFMNFTFELFFDRQDEAQHPGNPGVFVDYEYFDLVVRNIIPGQSTNNTLPDNGIMMVNPRDITVVFSPQITVQGRPLNASIVFEKFTHRMTPVRMRVQLTMRVVYFGPLREMTQYTQEEFATSARIPWGDTDPARYNFTYADLVTNPGSNVFDEFGGGDFPTDSTTGNTNLSNLTEQERLAHGASIQANARTVDLAIRLDNQYEMEYDASGSGRAGWPQTADCSSLVWHSYAEMGYHKALGWDYNYPLDTATMWSTFKQGNTCARLWGFPGGQNSNQWPKMAKMVKGDLLIRYNSPRKAKNHIAFVLEANEQRVVVFHAGSPSMDVGTSTYSPNSDIYYNYGVRPLPLGTGQVGSINSSVGGGNFTSRAVPV